MIVPATKMTRLPRHHLARKVPMVSAWFCGSRWRKSSTRRRRLTSTIMLVCITVILSMNFQEMVAFPLRNTAAYSSWFCDNDGRCSWRRVSFAADTTRYPTANNHQNCRDTPNVPRGRVILRDKPKGKEPEKPMTAPKGTKSVVQSFFSSEPPPPPPPPEEKTGSWRNLFRRNKNKDNPEEEASRNKSSSSSSSKQRRKSTTTKIKSTKKEQAQKPILSDKLRQQAQEDKPKQRPKTSSSKKNVKDKESSKDKDEEEDPSLWSRMTGWMPGRGNSTEETDNSNTGSGNSTNPLSAVQQMWQEAVKNSRRSQEEWVDVIPKTRLSPGEVVPVRVGGLDLLIIAGLTSDNRIYAIANSCPHLGTPLEVGQLVRLPKESATAPTTSDIIVNDPKQESANRWTELQVSSILQQDGCEDCIVCPLHRTAFALDSGQVRGEWCPYPPVVGKLTSLVKDPTPVATFDVRVRKKNIQVRLNSPLPLDNPKEK